MRGAEQAVHGEQRIERRLEHAQHDRHVLRLAARHHRVDGDLLDRARRQVRRNQSHDLVGLALGAAQHAQDALVRRRHDRQAVAPAALEAGLPRIVPVADRDLARLQAGLAVARDQRLLHAGLDRLGAAARLPGRQAVAFRSVAGDAQPLGAIPADRALDFPAALVADQRRHGLDLQVKRLFEREIVDHGLHARRKGRVVLGEHGQRAGAIERAHHRLDHDAGVALALGDDDEAVAGDMGVGHPFISSHIPLSRQRERRWAHMVLPLQRGRCPRSGRRGQGQLVRGS